MNELNDVFGAFNKQWIDDYNSWQKDYFPHLKKDNKEEHTKYVPVVYTLEEEIAESLAVWQILKGHSIFKPISKFNGVLHEAKYLTQITNALKICCLDMWNIAIKDGKNNYNDSFLYWARLALRTILKESINPILSQYPINIEGLLLPLEEWSRGFQSIQFEANTKKVIITGFDPFNYTKPNAANNPSASLAYYFHNRKFKNKNNVYIQIQAVIFPVRYKDFDDGLVEKFLSTIYPINQLDMIFTISQTPESVICIDRLAANYRGGYPDNNKIKATQGKIISKGADFYESTLPINEIILDSEINDLRNSDITTSNQIAYYQQEYEDSFGAKDIEFIKKGETKINYNQKTKRYNINSIKGDAVKGSGSNFLSNEIFYRVSHLRDIYNNNLKTGHIHVPEISSMPILKQIGKMKELFIRAFNVFEL